MEKLKGIIPDFVLSELPEIKELTTPTRIIHLLSQCSHESLNFTRTKENLNYKSSILIKVFPKYFTPEEAILYEKQPIKIANRVYANRMGNGDEASGDGFKYSGKGYIQLTGKDNYRRLSSYIGEDFVNYPDLVADKYPLASAAVYFTYNRLWDICDEGNSIEVITKLTKRINGGTNGLQDRISKFQKLLELIS